ncbi:unnamed protein product, partial [Effrenium voratum]
MDGEDDDELQPAEHDPYMVPEVRAKRRKLQIREAEPPAGNPSRQQRHLLMEEVAKPSRQRHVLMEEEMVKAPSQQRHVLMEEEMVKAPSRWQRHVLMEEEMVKAPSRWQRRVLMEEMAKAPGRRQRLMEEMAKDHVETVDRRQPRCRGGSLGGRMLPLMSGLLTTEALIMEVLNTELIMEVMSMEALILEVLNTELIMEVMSMEALILEVLNTELSMEVEIMEVRHDGETLIVAMRGIMEEVRSVLIRETLLVATRGVVLIMEAEPEEEWEDTWWAHVKDEEEEPADDSWWGNIKDEQETKEKPHDEAAAGGWSTWQSSWKSRRWDTDAWSSTDKAWSSPAQNTDKAWSSPAQNTDKAWSSPGHREG